MTVLDRVHVCGHRWPMDFCQHLLMLTGAIVSVCLTYWAAVGVGQNNGSEVCISGTRRAFASSAPESQTPARTNDLPERSSELETGAPEAEEMHSWVGRVRFVSGLLQ